MSTESTTSSATAPTVPRSWLATAGAGVALAASAGGCVPALAAHPPANLTVVLVHGALTDASVWSDVTRQLQRKGYPVLAPAMPLRGLASDSLSHRLPEDGPRADRARRPFVRRGRDRARVPGPSSRVTRTRPILAS